MKMLAPQMLAQYRDTTTPQFREVLNSFKSMTAADQRELLFYTIGYMSQQYAALLQMIHGAGDGPSMPIPPRKDQN